MHWTPDREAFAQIIDAVHSMQAVLEIVHGGKPKVKPVPRPVTAAERLKRRRRYEDHKTLVGRMLPGGYQPLRR